MIDYKGIMSIVNHALYKESLSGLLDCVCVKNQSFLITGASGLIGSCVVDLLMLANEKGWRNHVFALGRSREKLQSRFGSHLSSEYFHIIEKDVCTPLDNDSVFNYIIHCASNADPVKYARYPVETLNTNLLGGIHILNYAQKHSDSRLVILSSFEVYGDAGKSEYKEQDVGVSDFNLVRSCYSESKRAVETLTQSFCVEYGINASICRLCSVYGPTMATDDSKAQAQFLRSALSGGPIVLKSNGEQVRSYCYVMDVVSGIFYVLFKGCSSEVYNISYEKSVLCINEAASIIAEVSGSRVMNDMPSDLEKKGWSHPQDIILNNAKLKSLGWEGRYDFRSGVTECLNIMGCKSLAYNESE